MPNTSLPTAIRRPAIGLLMIFGITCSQVAVRADEWTSLSGTSTVSGELVGLWNGRVLLRLDGGRRVSVKLEDLRAESRIQAEKRFEQLQQEMAQRSEEIRAVAAEASAPAPAEMPELETTAMPAYEPPPPGSDLKQTLLAIRDQSLAGHPRVLFDTLPPSHQELAETWFRTVIFKWDVSFDTARQTLESLGELMISRQRWLFSHPRFAELTEAEQTDLLVFGEFLRRLFAAEVTGLDTLRSRPLAETVAAVDDAAAPLLNRLLAEQVAELSAMLPEIEVEPVADAKAGEMTAKFVVPVVGPIASITGYPLEQRWVWWNAAPQEAAQWWSETTEQWQAVDDGSVPLPAEVATVMNTLGQAVAALQQASTRQEFHRQLDDLLPELTEWVNQWSGFEQPQPQNVAGGFPGGEYQEEFYTPGGSSAGGSSAGGSSAGGSSAGTEFNFEMSEEERMAAESNTPP